MLKWLKMRREKRELRERFLKKLGFALVFPDEIGHERCAERVNVMLGRYPDAIERTCTRLQDLYARYPIIEREGLVWMEVYTAEQELAALIMSAAIVKGLAQEAGIEIHVSIEQLARGAPVT